MCIIKVTYLSMPCLFYPFVLSVDGALGHEVLMFLQCLADQLSGAWGKSYLQSCANCIKVHLALAVV